MEDQLAELAAQVAAIEAKGNMTNTMFAEAYYYITIPLMIIIHAGFLAYEMGASRAKNALSSGVKNILAFAFVIPAFYFFGWWVYWAMPTGFSLSAGPNGISGAEYAGAIALAWGDSAAYMGPNLADQIDGVFWGAFTLFADYSLDHVGCCDRAHSNGWVRDPRYYLRWIQLDTRCRLGLACRWVACNWLGCT